MMTRAAVAAVPVALVAADAARFNRRQKERLLNRPEGLRQLTAYLSKNPMGNCDLKGCTDNSIDSGCATLACQARDAACAGNYRSGKCKDLKELHRDAMCELAKPGCGDTLPNDPHPECRHWWSYQCRLAPILPTAPRRL